MPEKLGYLCVVLHLLILVAAKKLALHMVVVVTLNALHHCSMTLSRVRVRLYWKFAHSAQSPTLSTSQPYILILFPTLNQILKLVNKDRAFSKLKVNFLDEIATQSFSQ